MEISGERSKIIDMVSEHHSLKNSTVTYDGTLATGTNRGERFEAENDDDEAACFSVAPKDSASPKKGHPAMFMRRGLSHALRRIQWLTPSTMAGYKQTYRQRMFCSPKSRLVTPPALDPLAWRYSLHHGQIRQSGYLVASRRCSRVLSTRICRFDVSPS